MYTTYTDYKQGKSIPFTGVLLDVAFKEGVDSIEILDPDSSLRDYTVLILFPVPLACHIESQSARPTTTLFKEVTYNGWPPYKNKCPPELCEFFGIPGTISYKNGMVLKSNGIVMPKAMWEQVLKTIHSEEVCV